MSTVKVAINGYGTIGKRIADLVSLQDDMKLVGVSKIRPSFEAKIAKKRNYKLYTIKENIHKFEKSNICIDGTIDEMIENADIVIDCTPNKIGEENKNIYNKYDVKIIWQGGESKDIALKSFNANSNYGQLYGENYARIVSCNTTGICRLLYQLDLNFNIIKTHVSIIRRGADLADTKNGPIDSIVLDPISIPSHHGQDVNTILPHLNIITSAIKIPTTFMHLHILNIEFKDKIEMDDIIDTLLSQPRIKIIGDGISSTSEIIEYSRDLLRPRNDIWENCIFSDSINVIKKNLYLYQAIQQESIVIPENIDCIRSMFQLQKNKLNSIEKTDSTLFKFNQM